MSALSPESLTPVFPQLSMPLHAEPFVETLRTHFLGPTPIFRWRSHGKHFVMICTPHEFEASGRFTCKFASYKRQLHYYGFRKLPTHDLQEWYHPYFIRGSAPLDWRVRLLPKHPPTSLNDSDKAIKALQDDNRRLHHEIAELRVEVDLLTRERHPPKRRCIRDPLPFSIDDVLA